ncbi:MAG: hypothetical protein V2A62_00910 [Candidatus Woesearchaeota archaeon]
MDDRQTIDELLQTDIELQVKEKESSSPETPKYEIYEIVIGPVAEYFSPKMVKPLSTERWPQEKIRQRCAEDSRFRDLFNVITLGEKEAYARAKLSGAGSFHEFSELTYRFRKDGSEWRITETKRVEGLESVH